MGPTVHPDDVAIAVLFKEKLGRPDLTADELRDNWDELIVGLADEYRLLKNGRLIYEPLTELGEILVANITNAVKKVKKMVMTEITTPLWKLAVFGIFVSLVSSILHSLTGG